MSLRSTPPLRGAWPFLAGWTWLNALAWLAPMVPAPAGAQFSFADPPVLWAGAGTGSGGTGMAPDPFHWFRADTMGLTNGQAVTGWGNEGTSAVGNYAIGSTTFYSNNVLNSLPAVYFGGNGWLASHDTAAGYVTRADQPATIFLVWKTASASSQAMPFTLYCNSGTQDIYLFQYSDGKTYYSAGTQIEAPLNPKISESFYVMSCVANGTGSYVRTNGVLCWSGDAGTKQVGDPIIGNNIAGFGSGIIFTGWICELIVYTSHLATNNLADTESYLLNKYGL